VIYGVALFKLMGDFLTEMDDQINLDIFEDIDINEIKEFLNRNTITSIDSSEENRLINQTLSSIPDFLNQIEVAIKKTRRPKRSYRWKRTKLAACAKCGLAIMPVVSDEVPCTNCLHKYNTLYLSTFYQNSQATLSKKIGVSKWTLSKTWRNLARTLVPKFTIKQYGTFDGFSSEWPFSKVCSLDNEKKKLELEIIDNPSNCSLLLKHQSISVKLCAYSEIGKRVIFVRNENK
jgi:hypothetical protein